ncbi:hypothetical protein Goshw_015506 [Gossypium schwendimanii]|uniref:RNase H type-1 domain-containing protein n=1 Tax=Gossypium schwendimanii TaxID=34291 RepID=A0A7J9N0K1_GOSSC|nr:hypothetical protein [Gossypium schwendimanii]
MVHERKYTSGRDPTFKIQSYLIELEGVRESKLTSTPVRSRQREEKLREYIQFDAAFDINNSRSASGIVARGQNGEVTVSKSTLHSNVSSLFVAKALACFEATKLGIGMGLNSVTIMGDSKTIINKCKTEVKDKSILGAIIDDIQSNKTRF